MTAPLAFRDNVALVVGGSRGIGAAVARRLASLGAQVAIAYKSRRDAAESVVNEVIAGGGSALAFEADVSRPESVDTLVREVVARFGRIDILVNSAGIAPYRPLGSLDASFVRE